MTTTAADGSYSFTVNPGSYTVCEEDRADWAQTFPTTGASCAFDTHGGFTPARSLAITMTLRGRLQQHFGNTRTRKRTKSGTSRGQKRKGNRSRRGQPSGWNRESAMRRRRAPGRQGTAAAAANSFYLRPRGYRAYSFRRRGQLLHCERTEGPDNRLSSPIGGRDPLHDTCRRQSDGRPDLAMGALHHRTSGASTTPPSSALPATTGEGCRRVMAGRHGQHLWNRHDPHGLRRRAGQQPVIHTTRSTFFARMFLNGETVNEMLELVGPAEATSGPRRRPVTLWPPTSTLRSGSNTASRLSRSRTCGPLPLIPLRAATKPSRTSTTRLMRGITKAASSRRTARNLEAIRERGLNPPTQSKGLDQMVGSLIRNDRVSTGYGAVSLPISVVSGCPRRARGYPCHRGATRRPRCPHRARPPGFCSVRLSCGDPAGAGRPMGPSTRHRGGPARRAPSRRLTVAPSRCGTAVALDPGNRSAGGRNERCARGAPSTFG